VRRSWDGSLPTGLAEKMERSVGAGLRRWLFWFSLSCAALIVAVLGTLWAGTGFESLGVTGDGLAAMILTVVLVSGVAVALMALVFQSSRSGRDDLVYHQDGGVQDEGVASRRNNEGAQVPHRTGR
jgi:hypothetical protein